MDMQQLEQSVQEILDRNKKVENDKAWEGSWTRTICIMCITYVCAFLFMKNMNAEPAHLNALVPVLGYLLSTLTLPPLKSWWIKRNTK